MNVLLVDNYDSYSYNLAHLIAAVNGAEPSVITNDDAAWDQPEDVLADVDAVVISPGPGRPHGADVGCSTEVLARRALPTLGVCLGHQLVAVTSGATVAQSAQPRHGHLTTVRHVARDLFRDVPEAFTAVRYHSLTVLHPVPPQLEVLAWSEDDQVMAIRHRERPWWGVQFHPESISSEQGDCLINSFLELARSESDARSEAEAAAHV